MFWTVPRRYVPPAEWDPEMIGFESWLARPRDLVPERARGPEMTAARRITCSGALFYGEIAPGDERVGRGSVELRVPPGPLPDGGAYRLHVTFPADPDAVTLEVPLRVIDHPSRRMRPATAAAAAFASDERFEQWVAQRSPVDELQESFATELTWWRGAWELWVEARYAGGAPLRMRYSPERSALVDVRTIGSYSLIPEDDPDRPPRMPGEPRDQVLR